MKIKLKQIGLAVMVCAGAGLLCVSGQGVKPELKTEWMPRMVNINELIGTNHVVRIPDGPNGMQMGWKHFGEARMIGIGLREDGVLVWRPATGK